MQKFTTPMMKQYQKIKSDYRDCLLLFRLGDFYELFLEDAHIGARVLNITLTSRPKGKDGRIPMAGVPYHAVDSYLPKLVKAGYKVAICEQVSLPNKYGIVEREVVRVVTPGTLLDEKALEKKSNNYIVSISASNNSLSLSCADISTGFLGVINFQGDYIFGELKDELSRLAPTECILPPDLYNTPEFLKILKTQKGLNIFEFKDWGRFAVDPQKFLKNHFKVKTLASFGFDQSEQTLDSLSGLLGYLKDTQKANISHIQKITTLSSQEFLSLDRSTTLNLELFSTLREHDVQGSLLWSLDKTTTSMGGRLLKTWITKPLVNKTLIERRLEAVEYFMKSQKNLENFNLLLEEVSDIERLLSRLSVGLGNSRDIVNLKNTIKVVLKSKKLLSKIKIPLIKKYQKEISPDLQKLINLVDRKIVDEPPIDIREGGMIRDGVDNQLDLLKKSIVKSREWVLELEDKERKRTGISSLKVRFNKVFGFYIEISRANLSLIPDNYIRRQTLVNGERFITEDLKRHEEIILTAEEKIKEIEYQLFLKILDEVLDFTPQIQKAAESIAALDVLTSFSKVSKEGKYIKPKILYSGEIRIKGGRHPVVEKLLTDHQFVPNDVTLDNVSQSLLLITGPNMAGKSVLIRQVALIVLLAQIGCFVPATLAHLPITDRIFVRSGASDVITSGLSTFMVEMVETAYILHNATRQSLIVMDEIGRGTSTYDGISIAWATAEYLVTEFKSPPKTLFATHYHELQKLEEEYPKKIKNYHLAVDNSKGDPIFLYTLLRGPASHSFGVAVARLAGIPQKVIDRAQEILSLLEKTRTHSTQVFEVPQPKTLLPDISEQLIIKELKEIDISQTTPLQALNLLSKLKEKAITPVVQAETSDVENFD